MQHYQENEAALNPATIIYHPADPGLSLENCRWLSAPSIARTPKGRLWVSISMGGVHEGSDNFILLISSDDDGVSWAGPRIALDHPDPVRLFEPMIWTDPSGRVWLTWSQAYMWWDGRGGVWASTLIDADSGEPKMTDPRRVMNGVMAVQPYFGKTGRWYWPVACWKRFPSTHFQLPQEEFSMIYASDDMGQTFFLLGKSDVADRLFDEHAVVERPDGSMLMIVRTDYGFGSSDSFDGGKTWTEGKIYRKGPSAKSSLRRLADGRLVWITHNNGFQPQRSHMSALLSEDGGATWPYSLLLDGRSDVSYPGTHVTEDGRIYIVHDKGRYDDKEIMFHVIRAEDIVAGKLVCSDSRLMEVAAKGGGKPITKEELAAAYEETMKKSGIIMK
ncbi:MAG: glycoside hydrolase [Treponema sp.]|jgi:hypothetical protein|nr:glycoside hydrolase [Treponema sp.]